MAIRSTTHAALRAGFTLLELLLVVSAIALLAGIGGSYYLNTVRSFELSSTGDAVVSEIVRAQANAMHGNGGFRWGVHFDNTGQPYYQLFSTPTDFASASTTIVETAYLPSALSFTNPAASSTKDVIFERITGITASTSIIIASSDASRTIAIPTTGVAY